MTRKRVLVVTSDALGESMAGPAIRSFEIAKILSEVADVSLVSTLSADLTRHGLSIHSASRKQLRRDVAWADVIIFQGALLSIEPWIIKSKKILVADLYDPMHLEGLEQHKEQRLASRYVRSLNINSIINHQLKHGDFFICASEKQRDFWLGQLAAIGRVNPENYDFDSSLRSLIDVVPFGVQAETAVQKSHFIKGRIEGIQPSDKVILWGGGIYNWFDPLTLIRSVDLLTKNHSDVKLVFLGTRHPNPNVPEMSMLLAAKSLANELELTNRHVFFNEGWVPYEQRADALLDSDIGVSTHFDHLETAFSFRTRILDYIWAGLPIIATRGDTFEKIIEMNGLGAVVPPENIQVLAQALETLLFNEAELAETRRRVRTFRNTLIWPVVLEPLIQFVLHAEQAADARRLFSASLNRLDKSNTGKLGRRLLLYRASIKRFGIGSTVKSVFLNFKSRFD